MPNRISKYLVLVQLWICHVWKEIGFFFTFAFVLYFVCTVFLYCCCVFCILFLLLCCLFPISVQVYRTLPPGGNPVAINSNVSISIHHEREVWRTGIPSHSGCYIRLLCSAYNPLLFLLPHNNSTSLEMYNVMRWIHKLEHRCLQQLTRTDLFCEQHKHGACTANSSL